MGKTKSYKISGFFYTKVGIEEVLEKEKTNRKKFDLILALTKNAAEDGTKVTETLHAYVGIMKEYDITILVQTERNRLYVYDQKDLDLATQLADLYGKACAQKFTIKEEYKK